MGTPKPAPPGCSVLLENRKVCAVPNPLQTPPLGTTMGPALEAPRGPASACRAGLPRAMPASRPGHWALGFGCQAGVQMGRHVPRAVSVDLEPAVIGGSWGLPVLRRRLVHQLCLETARCME
ncbi:uncharacterized protein LOC130678882 isoform X3 [Manis pentadactyla]|uniref:uncharacterized protein LOC130678882 isoform X3 n=1 Tax=Manis pentadactyla TaxID=143292 RepID=UPI00255D05AF|nr:uncharacterized protein LOC130678882 isoform X3 [Manis pentadactyla]